MHTKIYNEKIEYCIEIIETIIGSAIIAIAVSLLLLPNQLSSGGFTGIATVIYYLFKVPMGTTIILLNIPLFLVAIYKLGKGFFCKTILGTISLSVFIDILDRLQPLTDDRFLSCIYGGVILGIGTSIILKAGSSTGGTDLVSNIVRKYNSNIKMGQVIIIMDIVIIGINVLVFKQLEIGLYSAIAMYLEGKMIDIVFEGIYFSKLMIIISEKNKEISDMIEKNVDRGITGLYGKGMYTKQDKLILMCVASRKDVVKIKKISQKIDDKCFIIISNAREVYGEGFKVDK